MPVKGDNEVARHFRAPWGTRLKLMTSLVMAIGLVVMWSAGPPASYAVLAIVLFAAAFAVRGYSVLDGQLLIHRLGWATRFDLGELMAAEIAPEATVGSIRMFGIGGLFGFVGRFRNEVLGPYRAYATDSPNTVVLEFTNDKVVITPDRPDELIAALQAELAGKGDKIDE